MSSSERIGLLMCELGPCDDSIEAIHQPELNEWSVSYESGFSVGIYHSEEEQKLTLSTLLGNASDLAAAGDSTTLDPEKDVESATSRPVLSTVSDTAEQYRALLSYNSLWQENGGVRIAKDGGERDLYVLLDIYDGEMQAGTLAGILERFTDISDSLRRAFFNAAL